VSRALPDHESKACPAFQNPSSVSLLASRNGGWSINDVFIRMELTRQAGHDPPLVGLMRVYKDYYPDVIVGDVTSGRASVFTVSIFDLNLGVCIKRSLASGS
jgi:hypothetical protein